MQVRRLSLLMAAAALAAFAALRAAPAGPVLTGPVTVEGGRIVGVSGENPAITVFKGIPFAAPPVGPLRWRAPRAVVAWTGVRQADRTSPSCIQTIVSGKQPWTYEFMAHGEISEDCLYANVWTPAKTAAERRPVFVYIYGGANVEGSTAVPLYDGEGLASKGLVVVTFNYRVGVLGFFSHPALGRRSAVSRLRQLRTARPDCCGALGARQHRGVRRRPGAGHDRRAVGRCERGPQPDGVAAGEGPVSAGDRPERLEPRRGGTRRPDDGRAGERRRQGRRGEGGRIARGAARDVVAGRDRSGLAPRGGRRQRPGAPFRRRRRRLRAAGCRGAGVRRRPSERRPDPDRQQRRRERRGAATRQSPPRPSGRMRGGASAPARTSSSRSIRPRPTSRPGRRPTTAPATWPGRPRICGRRCGPGPLAPRSSPTSSRTRCRGPRSRRFGAFHTAEVPYVLNTLTRSDRPFTAADRRIAATLSSYWANFATTGDPNGTGLPRWPEVDAATAMTMEVGDAFRPIPVAGSAAKLAFATRTLQPGP